MIRRSLIHGVIWLLALAVCWSCDPQVGPTGKGSVSLALKTSHTASATRATEPGDGTAADGGQIANDATYGTPDVMIFIVDESDPPAVAARYYPGCDPAVTTNGSLRAHYTATADTVTFANLDEGDYTVYAYANTAGLALSAALDPATIATQEALEGLLFAALTVPDTIALSNSRLPLAATAPLHVYSGHNGMVNLDLKRCLAKVSVELINQTGASLTLPNQMTGETIDAPGLSVTLKHMNPNQGYVFAHTDDIPSGAYTPGPCGDIVYECGPTIPAGDTLKLTRLVFPSDTVHCGGFTCDIDFYLGSDEFEYHDLPILNNRAQPLAVLARNTYLHIEVRISKKKQVSFNFSVSDWNTSKTETITFE